MESRVQHIEQEQADSTTNLEQNKPILSGATKAWISTLPNGLDIIDLFSINEDNFALKSIRLLLEERPFDLDIEANYPANTHLNHLYFESRNQDKIFGKSNLGIGYPMLLAEVEGESITAPLFFWRLRFDTHPSQVDAWRIRSTTEGKTVLPNLPLFEYIDAIHGTEFSLRAQRMVNENKLNTNTLKELCDGISLILKLGEGSYALGVTSFPPKKIIPSLQAKGTLHWSAITGLLPLIPQKIEHSTPSIVPDLESGLNWEHNFTLFPMDATQREALMAAQKNALTVVEGASGTGKTYTAANIIINALSNGCKTMVVSNSINALKRCQNYLLEGGFGDLSFLIRDIKGDKMMLLDMLRAASLSKNTYKYDKDVYRTVLKKTHREQKKLDKAWGALHHNIFGEWDFTDVAGQFLRANRSTGKEILASQLNPADFELTKAEYDKIREAIRSSEPLFKTFPKLNHPLSNLENGLFSNRKVDNAQGNVKDLVKSMTNQAGELHHSFIGKANEYAEMLTDYYEDVFEGLYVKTKKIQHKIEDASNNYGADFEKRHNVLESVYGVFSDHQKEITAQKTEVYALVKKLRTTHGLRKHFEFDFPKEIEGKNMLHISKIAADFEAALLDWRNRIPAIVREDVDRMNGKNAHLIVDFKAQTQDLEQKFDFFIQRMNQSGLYNTPFAANLMTIPQRQTFLENILSKLENTGFYMRDFEGFFAWQSHWLTIDKSAQKVIAALGKTKPKNWTSAFESWYLHCIAQKHFSADMHWEKDTLEMWSRGTDKIKELLPNQIGNLWQGRKKNALKELRAINPATYNLWFGKKNRALGQHASATSLVKDHIHPLTETLPVLLVTPEVAADVIRLSNMLFDLIIVDEAHNIPKQACYPLFDQAKNIVVLGDEKQDMTPFEQDDFLEFCKQNKAKTVHLEYQHQAIPEEWVRFNQIAFDTPFKRIPSRFAAKDVTTIANVGGRYDEKSKTNESEARTIINWLSAIEPKADKMYPSIGIACATVEQRDFIAGLLLKIIKQKSAGFEKLLMLQHNGLGVFQFKELQGHHVDVVMLSLTHGPTNSQNKMTSHFEIWNSHLGFNQLHVALTRSSARIYIAHSIPQSFINMTNEDGPGSTILRHLVQFGEAIQAENPQQTKKVIENLRTSLGNRKVFFPSKIFMEEVEISLQPYFEPGQIQRDVSIAGVTVPMLIQAEKGDEMKQYVLLFDGVLAESAYPSYEWEQKLKEYLNLNDIIEVPTLSLKWWKSPKQEARKLAGRILGK